MQVGLFVTVVTVRDSKHGADFTQCIRSNFNPWYVQNPTTCDRFEDRRFALADWLAKKRQNE